MLSSCIFC